MTTKLEIGCYIDGHWGHYGVAKMIDMAADLGYDDQEIITLARNKLNSTHFINFSVDDEQMLNDAADEVEAWLNEHVAEDGYSFGWHDGEFFYWANSEWEMDY